MSRTLIIPDCHHPYVDEVAWRCAMAAGRAVRPKRVVIIGDFADCYAVSAHAKSPGRKADLAWEIEQTNKALDAVDAIGAKEKIYCGGNHEYRMDRYIRDKAPELYGLKGTTVPELLHLKERGWKFVPYMDYIRIGKVAYTHEVGRCGANTASQSLRDFGGNLVVGHSHRASIVYQGTVKDGGRFCMNVGWLGSIKDIDYMHKARAERDWEHGFGIIDQDKAGIAWPQFVPIVYGRCIVDGKQYSGRR